MRELSSRMLNNALFAVEPPDSNEFLWGVEGELFRKRERERMNKKRT